MWEIQPGFSDEKSKQLDDNKSHFVISNPPNSVATQILISLGFWVLGWISLRWPEEAPYIEEKRTLVISTGFLYSLLSFMLNNLCLMASHGFPHGLVLQQDQNMGIIKVKSLCLSLWDLFGYIELYFGVAFKIYEIPELFEFFWDLCFIVNLGCLMFWFNSVLWVYGVCLAVFWVLISRDLLYFAELIEG